jgi:5-methylcytosine-specific restriction endonuclease McrA
MSPVPPEIRARVAERDRGCCRYCGRPATDQHHIDYRSQGGRHEEHNLIVLCRAHHDLMHTNKRSWQPILRAYIWRYYVEGRLSQLTALAREFNGPRPTARARPGRPPGPRPS